MRKQVLLRRVLHKLPLRKGTSSARSGSLVVLSDLEPLQVGGLPLVELNHLEIQFLLLNDFRLSLPVEELEAYGTMLVEFYAREVMAPAPSSQPMDGVVSTGSSATVIVSPP